MITQRCASIGITRRYVSIGFALIALCSILLPPVAGSSLPPLSDCTAAHAQRIAPSGMAIAPIANANLDLGPNPTGALAVPASSDAPGYCQLTGTVVTNNTTGKTANFAALLPENWNGKLLFQGCGGLCGVVFSGGVPGDELARGYAITATDDGHAANNSVFEAEWALTPSGEPNRDALVDVYYRAVHDVAITVKVLVTAWYSDELQHSYFEGCSGGGREAMVEAARYPSDFDGIIAGDPTFDYRGRTIRLYTTAKALLKSSGAYIDPRLLELVDRKIQQQCDASDGVKDGLIQNPAKCTFRAESLLCRNGNTAECLTEDQVGVLDHYLNAAKDERGLVASFGGPVSDIANSSLATDVEAAGPPVDIYAAEPWGDSPPTSWFAADNILRYLVYRDPDFNSNADFPMGFSNIIADPAIHLLDRRTEGLDGDDPSKLSTFLADGRKLILYQGYSDGRVSPFATIRFYENAARLSGGLKQLQKGVRLFLEPGMYHCGGGPGPNSFDMLRALEGWVENQVGPDAIPAVKFVNDDPTMGVFRTMPLCKFPEAARYRGDGDVNDGLNWSCPSEDQSLLETGLDGDRAGLRLSVVPEKHEHGQTEHNDPRR